MRQKLGTVATSITLKGPLWCSVYAVSANTSPNSQPALCQMTMANTLLSFLILACGLSVVLGQIPSNYSVKWYTQKVSIFLLYNHYFHSSLYLMNRLITRATPTLMSSSSGTSFQRSTGSQTVPSGSMPEMRGTSLPLPTTPASCGSTHTSLMQWLSSWNIAITESLCRTAKNHSP